MLARKPIPDPDIMTKPFWDAVDRKVLTAQRCTTCQRFQHPPLEACRHCGSRHLIMTPLSGRGTIYSYQVVHDSRVHLFKPFQPYAVLVVESAESPDILFIANLAPGPSPTIGADVEVVFEAIEPPGRFLPQFRVVENQR